MKSVATMRAARAARTCRIYRADSAGFSLIELLVSMVIGLVVTLAITSVLIRTEGSKRSTTSVNDINQTGAFTTFVLDRAIRSAGSGFSQSWSTSYGCLLDVKLGATNTPILPIPSAIPASSAFAGVTSATLATRLAPVIIGKGLADAGGQVRGDVLMVMAGTAGGAETATPSAPNAGTTPPTVALSNTLNFRTTGGDMILLADPSNPAGCMVQQVSATTPTTLSLGGTYYAATGTNINLATFGATTIVMQLGKDVDNPPQFQLFGVGDNNTLVNLDLLKPITLPDASLADGVVEMRALYGISNGPTYTTLDTWVDPTGATWGADVLTNGSAASRVKMRQIVAVRVGLILRTSLQERPQDYQLPVGTALTLFADLPTALQQTRTLTGSELNYRYRTIEVTVPLRNVLMAPQS